MLGRTPMRRVGDVKEVPLPTETLSHIWVPTSFETLTHMWVHTPMRCVGHVKEVLLNPKPYSLNPRS